MALQGIDISELFSDILILYFPCFQIEERPSCWIDCIVVTSGQQREPGMEAAAAGCSGAAPGTGGTGETLVSGTSVSVSVGPSPSAHPEIQFTVEFRNNVINTLALTSGPNLL